MSTTTADRLASADERLEEVLLDLHGRPLRDPRRERLRAEAVLHCLPLADGLAHRYVGRGIDREDLEQVARLALRDGANAVLGARRREKLEAAARELDPSGERVAICPTDITDAAQCQRLVATAAERFGGLDAVVQVAALDLLFGGVMEASDDDWRASFRPPFEGVRIVGNRFSPDAHRVRDFLTRNLVPYRFLDVETSEEAVPLLKAAGDGPSRRHCTACFSGRYPVAVAVPDESQLRLFEKARV